MCCVLLQEDADKDKEKEEEGEERGDADEDDNDVALGQRDSPVSPILSNQPPLPPSAHPISCLLTRVYRHRTLTV